MQAGLGTGTATLQCSPQGAVVHLQGDPGLCTGPGVQTGGKSQPAH